MYTHASLKTAIKHYCQNSETTFVDHIDDFIISVEDKVFSAIQMAVFFKSDSSEVTVANQSDYVAAAGSLDIISVRIGEDPVDESFVLPGGPIRYLIRKDYDFLLEAYPGTATTNATGIPKYYAISSASTSGADPTLTIRLGPIPDVIYGITIDYYGKAAADSLIAVTGGTWLSKTFPQVLLNGCLFEAYTFMKGEPDLIQNYQSQFQEGVMMIKNLGEGRQNEDSYVDGTMRVPSQ